VFSILINVPYLEGKTVVRRGKRVVRGGKGPCTSREASLHSEGRIAVPRGKKIAVNLVSSRFFSNAQQDPTDLPHFLYCNSNISV
jgi:hypothetical protein